MESAGLEMRISDLEFGYLMNTEKETAEKALRRIQLELCRAAIFFRADQSLKILSA